MSNALMTIGLLGLLAGIIAPIFRVLNKKPKRSKGWVIIIGLSFSMFVLGAVIGM